MAAQQNSPGQGFKSHRRWLPRWRVFTWVILAFNLIMLIWVISAIASNARTCNGLTGDALTNCEAGNVGVGAGVIILIVVWALVDVILGVLWLVTRPHTRTCPVCGNSVHRGVTRCGSCGFDFAQQLQPPPATTGWGQGGAPPQPPPRPPVERSDWGKRQ